MSGTPATVSQGSGGRGACDACEDPEHHETTESEGRPAEHLLSQLFLLLPRHVPEVLDDYLGTRGYRGVSVGG